MEQLKENNNIGKLLKIRKSFIKNKYLTVERSARKYHRTLEIVIADLYLANFIRKLEDIGCSVRKWHNFSDVWSFLVIYQRAPKKIIGI